MKLSARNQLEGRVLEVQRGEAATNAVLDVSGQRLCASITSPGGAGNLAARGDDDDAVIKASDVIIGIKDAASS